MELWWVRARSGEERCQTGMKLPFRYDLRRRTVISNKRKLANRLRPRHLQNCISASGHPHRIPMFRAYCEHQIVKKGNSDLVPKPIFEENCCFKSISYGVFDLFASMIRVQIGLLPCRILGTVDDNTCGIETDRILRQQQSANDASPRSWKFPTANHRRPRRKR